MLMAGHQPHEQQDTGGNHACPVFSIDPDCHVSQGHRQCMTAVGDSGCGPRDALSSLAVSTHCAAGQPEPLALDERGKPLHVLHQCCVEQRHVDADGADSVVRWAALSTHRRRQAMRGNSAA